MTCHVVITSEPGMAVDGTVAFEACSADGVGDSITHTMC